MRVVPVVLVLALVGGIAGPLGVGAAPPPVLIVVQENVVPGNVHTWKEPLVVVPAGTTVTWRNTGGLKHTLTETLPPTVGPTNVELAPGEETSFTFTAPGVYVYHCVPHMNAGMRGVVVVTA